MICLRLYGRGRCVEWEFKFRFFFSQFCVFFITLQFLNIWARNGFVVIVQVCLGRQWIVFQGVVKLAYICLRFGSLECVLLLYLKSILCRVLEYERRRCGYRERVSECEDVFESIQRFQSVVIRGFINYLFFFRIELYSGKYFYIFKYVDY